MKKNIMENIALTIVRAQACSDAGKYIHRLNLHDYTSQELVDRRYAAKDEQILKAVHIISRLTSEKAGVRFEVVEDKSGVAKYIIYFTYYLENQKRQISFHCFSEKVGRFCRKNPTVRWDHGDSRANCKELIEHFGF